MNIQEKIKKTNFNYVASIFFLLLGMILAFSGLFSSTDYARMFLIGFGIVCLFFHRSYYLGYLFATLVSDLRAVLKQHDSKDKLPLEEQPQEEEKQEIEVINKGSLWG